MSVYPLECFLCVSMFQGCFRSIAGVFQKAFKSVFNFIFSKNVINKLTTMSKNPAFSQKILEDWLTLPERQELFAGLVMGFRNIQFVCHVFLYFNTYLYLWLIFKSCTQVPERPNNHCREIFWSQHCLEKDQDGLGPNLISKFDFPFINIKFIMWNTKASVKQRVWIWTWADTYPTNPTQEKASQQRNVQDKRGGRKSSFRGSPM